MTVRMESTLFRKEAVDAQDLHRYGEISLNQPVSVRVAVAVGTTLLVVLFLCTATYAKRIRVAGQLVSSDGLSTLYGPENGLVSILPAARHDPGGRYSGAEKNPDGLDGGTISAEPETGERTVASDTRVNLRRVHSNGRYLGSMPCSTSGRY